MDRRIIKTKEAIRSSYFKLINEKKEGRITIAELTRMANIDRKTFYLHYGSVDDILKDFCDEKIRELIDLLKATTFFDDPFQLQIIFTAINTILEKDMDYYRLLVLRNYKVFWDRIHQIMLQALMHVYSDSVTVEKDEWKVYCDFFISGMIQVYQDFLNDPQSLTSEQLGHVVTHIALHGVADLFKR